MPENKIWQNRRTPHIQIGTKKAYVMKFRGAILEMIWTRHTKNGPLRPLGVKWYVPRKCKWPYQNSETIGGVGQKLLYVLGLVKESLSLETQTPQTPASGFMP